MGEKYNMIFDNGKKIKVDIETYNKWYQESGELYYKTTYFPNAGTAINTFFKGDGIDINNVAPELWYAIETDMTDEDYQLLIDKKVFIEGLDLHEARRRKKESQIDLFFEDDFIYSFSTQAKALKFRSTYSRKEQGITVGS